jgi:hypothetical protein
MDGNNNKEQNKAQMFRFTSINARLLPLLSLKNASPETCLAGRPRMADVAKLSIEASL